MLDGNDFQVIKQIVNEVVEQERAPTELETKLKEAQHEANFTSARLCTKEKQLQKIKDILYRVQQQGNGLVVMTQMQYDQLLDILDESIM